MLEIEQKINEIPNEVVKNQVLANFENERVRSFRSKECINNTFLKVENATISNAVFWAVYRPEYTQEGIIYWYDIIEQIDDDPHCTFLDK